MLDHILINRLTNLEADFIPFLLLGGQCLKKTVKDIFFLVNFIENT